MNKKKYIWIAIGVIVLAFIGYRVYSSKNKTNFEVAYTVTNQDVRQTVLATGSVTSDLNLNLSFKNSGLLARLNVKIGQQVTQGQVLAALDQRDASAALSQASAAVASAKANYQKVIAGATGPQIDVAKAAVASAQVALDSARNSQSVTIAQQKTAVSNAFSTMLNSGLTAAPGGTNFSTATATVSGSYTGSAQGSYNITINATGNGYYYNVGGLENNLGPIQRGVALPIGSRGLFITFSSTGNINAGDSYTVNIPNTQAANYLANSNAYQTALQTQAQTLVSSQNAVDAAQAGLDQANAQLELQQSAARPEDIAAAQAQVQTAQAQLQTANNQYSSNEIIAPISGEITSIDAKLGEAVGPSKEVIVLLDRGTLHVETNISESSISQIQVGQNIDMTFDAFGPSKNFTGSVISIDPASKVISGVINYRVLATLPTDPDIKPGMTVNMTILIADKPNVLAVPNRLIKTGGNGTYVTLLNADNKTTRDVSIQTGLAGDSYTEVVSGLNSGDKIATAIAK